MAVPKWLFQRPEAPPYKRYHLGSTRKGWWLLKGLVSPWMENAKCPLKKTGSIRSILDSDPFTPDIYPGLSRKWFISGRPCDVIPSGKRTNLGHHKAIDIRWSYGQEEQPTCVMFEGPRELNESSSEIVCEESKKWWLRKGTTARRFAYKKDELKRRRNIRSTTNKPWAVLIGRVAFWQQMTPLFHSQAGFRLIRGWHSYQSCGCIWNFSTPTPLVNHFFPINMNCNGECVACSDTPGQVHETPFNLIKHHITTISAAYAHKFLSVVNGHFRYLNWRCCTI